MKQILLLLSLFFAVSVNAQKKIIVTGGGGGGGTPIDTTGAFVNDVVGLTDTTIRQWKGGVASTINVKGRNFHGGSGITRTGQTFNLGGTLTGNTFINLGTYAFQTVRNGSGYESKIEHSGIYNFLSSSNNYKTNYLYNDTAYIRLMTTQLLTPDSVRAGIFIGSDGYAFSVRSGTGQAKRYSFPLAAPSSGQILKANGSGDLEWANESGGGSEDLQSVTDRDSITTRKVTVRDFNISGIPEFENNDSALANGLNKGDVYRLPYDTTKKAYLLAITDLPPPSDSLLLRILTNDAGASLPFSDSASFASYFISDNPSLNVTSYELVGDELIVRGNGFNYLTDSIFSNNTSIVEVKSETVATIGEYAFNSCKFLTDVSFPSATTIGDYAFGGCEALTDVSFPSATTIGDYAFENCTYLASISFPSVTTIGDYAFQGCSALTDISFPAAITIGDYAFKYCSALTEVNLTNFPLVTYWGDNALSNCTGLTTFETNATTIRPNVLENCDALIDVTLNSAAALFDILGGSAYINGNGTYNMTFTMPNLNNIINDPFADIISNGIIGGGTDFTITVPSAMTGNAKILDAQSAGAIIVGL